MIAAILVLLTPILLLAIVGLLGFVGCSFQPRLSFASLFTISTGAAQTSAISTEFSLNGGELLLATVQWGSPPATPSTPSFSPAFQPVPGGGPFDWNGLKIQAFSIINNQKNGSIVATLVDSSQQPVNSPVEWSVSFSSYLTKAASPFYSPVATNPTLTGTDIKAPPVTANQGDAIYAVAYAADDGAITGAFPGNNSLSAPKPANGGVIPGNPLLLDIENVPAGPVTVEVTNSNTGPTPKGFIFAVAVAIQ
jgi:hypothetical protein